MWFLMAVLQTEKLLWRRWIPRLNMWRAEHEHCGELSMENGAHRLGPLGARVWCNIPECESPSLCVHCRAAPFTALSPSSAPCKLKTSPVLACSQKRSASEGPCDQVLAKPNTVVSKLTEIWKGSVKTSSNNGWSSEACVPLYVKSALKDLCIFPCSAYPTAYIIKRLHF